MMIMELIVKEGEKRRGNNTSDMVMMSLDLSFSHFFC